MKTDISKKIRNMSARMQRGYSLMEVLVAIIVLAVGLLGIAGLQIFSLKNTHSAYLRSQATLLAYDIIDSMRANPTALASYDIDIGDDPTDAGTYASCVGTSASCTVAQLAIYDIHQWKCSLGVWAGATNICDSGDLATIAGLLPGGDGSVNVSGNDVTVTVEWIDKDEREKASTAAAKKVNLAITSRIR